MSDRLPSRLADLDRADPKQARAILELRVLPEPEERRVAYALFGDCIAACREHPAGFGLTLGVRRLALNTGWSKAIEVHERELQVRCDLSTVGPDDRAWVSQRAIGKEGRIQDLPDSRVWRFSRKDLLEVLRRLRGAVLASVEQSLANKEKGRRIIWWESHSSGALQVLAEDLAVQLPEPDYAVQGQTHYWKIAPESGGKLWPAWCENGEATIGWDRLGDVRRFGSKEEFEAERARIEAEDSTYTRAGADQVWKFRHIAPGDRVLANRGTSEVLGIGEVERSYSFEPERGEHAHVLKVRWQAVEPFPVDQRSWRRTLIELGPATFRSIVDGAGGAEATPRTGIAEERRGGHFERVLSGLGKAQLRFTSEVVADFLLALQTKRFVILSGISGTGKTRLAMEVARAHPARTVHRRAVATSSQALEITVAPYMLKYARTVIPVELATQFDWPEKVDGRSPRVRLEYPGGSLEQTVWKNDQRNVAILLFSKDAGRWFRESVEEGQKFVLEPVEEDGEAVGLKISLPATVEEVTTIPNLVVVPVRPDWTDQRGLLGYFNPITEQYVTTAFLDLVLRATRHPEHPFFAILDEMNLARVEHYFADFLSALESGEPLSLHDVEAVEDGSREGPVVPRQICVPPNLFFVGTVNVDESTYMFSSKVLDRAFTLEFNEVDLGTEWSDVGPEDDGALWLQALPESLVRERGPEPRDWTRLGEQFPDAADAVRSVHAVLEGEHRHFGYRVANEVARFVLLAIEQGGEEVADAALDLALLHKVLPKLHGTQQELEPLLDRLLAFAVFGNEPSRGDVDRACGESGWCLARGRLTTEQQLRAEAEEADVSEDSGDLLSPRLPRFGAKIWRMRRRLQTQGFTSFIE